MVVIGTLTPLERKVLWAVALGVLGFKEAGSSSPYWLPLLGDQDVLGELANLYREGLVAYKQRNTYEITDLGRKHL